VQHAEIIMAAWTVTALTQSETLIEGAEGPAYHRCEKPQALKSADTLRSQVRKKFRLRMWSQRDFLMLFTSRTGRKLKLELSYCA